MYILNQWRKPISIFIILIPNNLIYVHNNTDKGTNSSYI